MAFTFKKQIFGFMDLLRFKKLVPNRRKMLAEGSAQPLPKSYAVNETARILHPGYQKATLAHIEQNTADTKTYTFEAERPFYFRAGQYVTLGCEVDGSVVSRPYAISSAPKAALERRVSLTVKKCGFFSGYLFDRAKAGGVFTLGDPSGEFCYEPVKDAKHIVAIAGGSGITPFYSMAQAIADGTIDCKLTIFYGADREEEVIFHQELDALAAGSDKIEVVYVLSEEQEAGYEHGFIGEQLLRKYVSGDFTAMLCGSDPMYAYLDKQLAPFALPPRRIKRRQLRRHARRAARKLYADRARRLRYVCRTRRRARDHPRRDGARGAARARQVPRGRLRLLPQQAGFGQVLPRGGGQAPPRRRQVRLPASLLLLSRLGHGAHRSQSLTSIKKGGPRFGEVRLLVF